MQDALEEGAHEKPGRVQHVPASEKLFITLGRAFPKTPWLRALIFRFRPELSV